MDAQIEKIAKSLYFSYRQTDIGLFYGKMGSCLFFFHYSHVAESRIFGEFAEELLDEVMEYVRLGMPVGLSFGWAGIGWGIEYLVRYGFVEDAGNEERNKIDKKVTAREQHPRPAEPGPSWSSRPRGRRSRCPRQ